MLSRRFVNVTFGKCFFGLGNRPKYTSIDLVDKRTIYCGRVDYLKDESAVNDEVDPTDFGALSKNDSSPVVLHRSLVSQKNVLDDKTSIIDELLVSNSEGNIGDEFISKKKGFCHSEFYYFRKISRLCMDGDTKTALKEFFNMVKVDGAKPSLRTVCILLDSLSAAGDSLNAFGVFKLMKEIKMVSNQGIYSRLFSSCATSVDNWFRVNKYLLPRLDSLVNQNALCTQKVNAMNHALAPEFSMSKFGGPAVQRIHYLWRHLLEHENKFNIVSYNSLLSALAKAGDIHGCLSALDMLYSKAYSESKLVPDVFTLSQLLLAFKRAHIKRTLAHLSSSQPSLSTKCSSLQCAIILWHNLIPKLKSRPSAYVFSSMLSVLTIVDADQSATNPPPIYLSPQFLQLGINSIFQLEGRESTDLVQTSISTRDEPPSVVMNPSDYTYQQVDVDWTDTTLAIQSPINILLPSDHGIKIPTNKIHHAWQNLALVGGLHGFIDTMVRIHHCSPNTILIGSLLKLSPPPHWVNNEDPFDQWELAIFEVIDRYKVKYDVAIYNSLLNRRIKHNVPLEALYSKMTLSGLRPDSVTMSILASGCTSVKSLKQLLYAYQQSSGIIPHGRNLSLQPSSHFFASVLSSSKFRWDVKLYVLNLVAPSPTSNYYDDIEVDSDTTTTSDDDEHRLIRSIKFDGFYPDKALIAAIDIDIAQFRELIRKGIIPKDGSPVDLGKTGGFFVGPHALKSFNRFLKVYKRWIKSTYVVN